MEFAYLPIFSTGQFANGALLTYISRGRQGRTGHGAGRDVGNTGIWYVLVRPGASLLKYVSGMVVLHVVNIAVWVII